MNNLKGPIILFIFIGAIMVVWFFGKSFLFDKDQIDSSDAGQTYKLKVAGDGYLGYWFLSSPKMRIMGPKRGFTIDFTDDGGAYSDRLKKFNKGTYDCIVLPINSYLQHGKQYRYPGVIIAAISESKGADALVGHEDVMPNNKINDLNNNNLKIVYTSESPSSFLIDLLITDFDFDQLRKDDLWRKEVGSSEEAYELAKKSLKDRSKGDAFVMWEPEVSKAINKLKLKKLWGSDQFKGYIVDVFVFHRDFVLNKPDVVKNFLSTYFRVIDYYVANKEEMIKEMSNMTRIPKSAVSTMVNNIDWFDLYENAYQQFGIKDNSGTFSQDRIVSSILACSNILQHSGKEDYSSMDPYRILNSSFLENVLNSGVGNKKSIGDSKKQFEAKTKEEWAKMHEMGTMRVEPITFQSGTNHLDYSGKEIVDRVSKLLKNNYPNYRVIIRGHTSPGDQKANLELSQKRAEIVKDELLQQGLNDVRVLPQGVGSSKPPKQKANESFRALRTRMSRVEFILMEENTL